MLKSVHSSHNETFLKLLRRRRVSMGLRQKDLAVRIGRGQGTVSKVERGERRLDVIELRAWLRALDLDFATFARDLDQELLAFPIPELNIHTLPARRHRIV
ncbi:helix-turn-helix domain-containing protein [Paucibacter sp. TC2R-5]|uniref:helix-turn-helix domain-containing protein n=1 Tax=Paucibacter sp. TC2R-5 TaxID=2893555 RepID=UPI0021E443E0|nr:helix-turn-helix transcriptional regulator [Paucibacter sp. TC2R-5]MCV2361639.1 helix-turn-helix domain-containing protein [Paucibacter sp. TC2R-5]